MVKVLSLKVPDRVYDIVHNLDGSHSEILRQALDEFLEKHYDKLKKHK